VHNSWTTFCQQSNYVYDIFLNKPNGQFPPNIKHYYYVKDIKCSLGRRVLSLQIKRSTHHLPNTLLLQASKTPIMKAPTFLFFATGFVAHATASALPIPNGSQQSLCSQCSPSPGHNTCDITTACISTVGAHQGSTSPPNYCACRAGYKAATTDPNLQWRLSWSGQDHRVLVAPGQACNTLCNEWWLGSQGCQEVAIKDQCR
jgi:hypothetical protein